MMRLLHYRLDLPLHILLELGAQFKQNLLQLFYLLVLAAQGVVLLEKLFADRLNVTASRADDPRRQHNLVGCLRHGGKNEGNRLVSDAHGSCKFQKETREGQREGDRDR